MKKNIKFKKILPFAIIGTLFPIVFSFGTTFNLNTNINNSLYNSAKETTTSNEINSFNDYETIANEPTMQSISTIQGFFGKTKDNKTIVLTSYDGMVVWQDRIVDNIEVINYYKEKGIDNISDYKMHSWAYTEIGTNKLLSVLFGDSTNKNMTVFAYSITDGQLFGGLNNNYPKIVDVKDGMTTLNRLSNGNIIASKFGKEDEVKNIRTVVTINNNGLSKINVVSDIISDDLLSETNKSKYENATFLYFSNGRLGSKTNAAVFLGSDNHYFVIAVDDNLIPYKKSNNSTVVYYSDVTFTEQNTGIFKSTDDIPKYGFTLNQNSSSYFILNFIGASSQDKTILLNLNNYEFTLKAYISHNQNKFRYSNYDSLNNSLYVSYYESPSKTRVIKWDISTTSTGEALTNIIPVDDTTSANKIEYPFLITPVVTSKKYQLTPFLYMRSKDGDVPTAVFQSGEYLARFNIKFNRWYDPINAFKSDSNLYKYKLPSSVTNDDLKSKLVLFSMNNSIDAYSISVQNKTGNDDNGTLSATYSVQCTNWWDRTTTSSFTIPFHVENMYKKSYINFSFVTSKTNDNSMQFDKIEELKKSKYAKDITKKDVIDNFIVYDIKDKNLSKFNITDDMITLTANGNTLTVTITLPSSSFPTGLSNDLLRYTYDFSGFKDTNGYTFHFLNSDEQSQNDGVKLLKNSKYPSEIEYDSSTMLLTDNGKRDIFNNFIQLGFAYNTNYSSWEVKLKSVDNVNGNLEIEYIKYVDASVGNDFPEELKNVLGDTTISGFKKLSDSFETKPEIIKYVGTLTPSALWNEYQTLLNNGNVEQSTLFKSLSFELVNPKYFDIKVLNLSTSTKDKKLDLEISLKDNSTTNLIVNGKYLVLDKQTNDGLKDSLKNVYPYKVSWEIDSQSYVFEWDTNNNQDGVSGTNDYLSIDIEKAKYDFMNSNMYVDEVKDADLLSLFTLQNYEISGTPEISRNRAAGTITIVFSITQVDPGENTTRINKYNGNIENDSNNQKVIFIKNFKIPFNPITQYVPAIILCIALVVLISIIIMLVSKNKNSVVDNPLSRKRKIIKKLNKIKK